MLRAAGLQRLRWSWLMAPGAAQEHSGSDNGAGDEDGSEAVGQPLASVSVIRQQELTELMPDYIPDVLMGTPGVWFQERADDPEPRSISADCRISAGWRWWSTAHGRTSSARATTPTARFISSLNCWPGSDVVRGPVANIYGSGAIGGVASFRTKDVNDILKPGEKYGIVAHGILGSNMFQNLELGIRRRPGQRECRHLRWRDLSLSNRLPR